MNKTISLYGCSYRFYRGELREDSETDVFAQTRRDAAIILVAQLLDKNVRDLDEATTDARVFLAHELGLGWSVDDLLQSDLQVWADAARCGVIHDIWVKKP